MPVHEAVASLEWIYATLSADTTLTGFAPGGGYRGMAPPNTATPFWIMSLQAGADTITMNAYRILSSQLFVVKAVGPATQTAIIANAAARIDTLLKLASGNVTGGAILSCYRESPLFVDELVNGEVFSNIGGLYRILVEQTS